MKVSTCIVFLGVALACILHQTSAQQNWWERGPDGSPTIAASRATVAPTQATAAATTQAPASITNCPCPVTPEYNPVCGNDRMTYTNPGMLECAQSCGRQVTLLFHGRCEKVA